MTAEASQETLREGRYRVRGVLGSGAQGVTLDALDLSSGRAVAIKRFDVRGASSWKDVELAEREARVLATIDHPQVPRYLEHFEEGAHLYLVMDKIEGETLATLIAREGPLDEAEVRRFLASADRVFAYLHGRASPVVHRDVKPRNIVRRPDGRYVFVDFGTVREVLLQSVGSTVAGTYGYMAPEQVIGRTLPATDVYAVGVTALVMLTGKEPENLPRRGLRFDLDAALRGRVSDALTEALENMLAPDPEHRASSLEEALDGLTERATPAPAPTSSAVPASGPVALRQLRTLLVVLGVLMLPVAYQAADGEVNVPGLAVPFLIFAALAVVLFALRKRTGAERFRVAAPTLRQRVVVLPADEGAREPALATTEIDWARRASR